MREFFERGYDFLPVDINKSHATKFLPENGKIRLPFTSLPGLGSAAAESIMNAMRSGTVLSVEDLRVKAKVSKSVLELLENNNALRGMSQSNQITMF